MQARRKGAPAASVKDPAPDPALGRFFPQRKPLNDYLAGEGEVLTARIEGVLVEEERCLGLRPADGAPTYTIIWPDDYRAEPAGDGVRLFDGTGQPVAQIGDRILLDGGPVRDDTTFLWVHLAAPFGTPCPPPYWIAREGVNPENRVDESRFPDPAEHGDLEWYAEEQHISAAQAAYRIDLREALGTLPGELETNEAGTFGGFWIQNAPDYRFIMQFTENGVETLRPYIENAPYAGVVEVRTVDVTLQELEAGQALVAAATDAMREMDEGAEALVAGTVVNVVENTFDVTVTDRDRYLDLLEKTEVEFPPYIRVMEGDRAR